ncbi:MAG TPA: ATP-binding protein [Myxococcales bacterium]|jgi:signal transduction histidine kinase
MSSSLTLRDWVTLASCAGQLALATLALARISKSPLALPLALLCLDLFAMNGSDVANAVTLARGPQQRDWVWADSIAASLLLPAALYLVLAFVGKRRAWRVPMGVAWAYYGGIAAFCATAFLGVQAARDFAGNRPWSYSLLPGTALFVPAMVYLLASHLRESPGTLEKARTWLVVGAYALGFVGNFADLLANTGMDTPRLGPLGTLLATLVLTGLTLRAGLLERRVPWLLGVNALVAAVVQLFAYLAVFHYFGEDDALLALAGGTITLALLPALVLMSRSAAAHRQRLEYHATLGRFSAQMAHDLRNPLAAIKGAAQFLAEAQDQGQPAPDAREYLQLIVDQADRLGKVVADYQRMGRVEPKLQPADLSALVDEVLSAQQMGAPKGVTLEKDLAKDLPKVSLDPDLFSSAVENLVRNAFEAMEGGGVVTARTELRADQPGFLEISIADTGKGMDARAAEHAFTEFYTTKTTGSGLGLAFVRRVAEAHGGQASLSSVEGKGTTVRLRVPIAG